jgi:hypothetical protein
VVLESRRLIDDAALAATAIKATRRVTGADLERLRSFADDHPDVPRFVVTPSSEPHQLKGVLVTNWADVFVRLRE